MVLEFSITPIAINIREDGQLISAMVKEHFGSQIQKINLEDSIQEIGKTIRNKVVEQCFTNKVIDMMECGWITCLMVKEE